MTSKHRTIGAMVAIPVIMCLLGSCSQAPIPSTYIMNSQKNWAIGDILSLGVGLGVLADLNRGIDTGDTPDVEVIITTSMVFDSRYMMRKSDIYYIHKPDWWHYGKDGTNDAKTYHVVN